MNLRGKGKQEFAFNRGSILIKQAYNEAVKGGMDEDDIVYLVYSLATHKTDFHIPPTATRESAFELRLKSAPNSAETPVQEELQENRNPPPHDADSGKDQCCLSETTKQGDILITPQEAAKRLKPIMPVIPESQIQQQAEKIFRQLRSPYKQVMPLKEAIKVLEKRGFRVTRSDERRGQKNICEQGGAV